MHTADDVKARNKASKTNKVSNSCDRGRPLRDAEAAEMLGLAPRTLPQWRQRGQGPVYVKIGKAVRYFERDLIAFIDSGAVDPTAERS